MFLQSFIIPIIKVTDSCNFSCEYCFYSQRKLASRLMKEDECKKIIKDCFEYNVNNHNERMRVIFHGGEPLLQPQSFYENMVAYEKELAKKVPGFEFYNSIQTNGYLLDDKWADFFLREKFDIGISIDGNAKYNQHFGEHGVIESTERVLNNMAILKNRGIPFGVISVITNKHTENAEALYDFCIEHEIHDLSLNYCYNPESGDTVENEKLITFVKKLFDLYYNGTYELNVREFNETIAKKMGYCTDTCATCDRNNCGQYLAFDVYGNVYFCDTEYDKNSAVGNINEFSLYEILDSYNYLEKVYKCRKVYQEYCKNCHWLSMCGGGCHRYDRVVNGQYENNYFCETHKALCEYIEVCLDK